MNYWKLKTKLAFDSFLYSKQRKSASKNIICVTISIVLAIILALLVSTIIGYNPINILEQLFTTGFINYKALIINIVVLGIGGLAFSFAFKAGIFNIGMSGQLLGSGLTVLVVSTALQNVNFPNGTGQLFMLLIAITTGGFIACIIGLLKVYFNVNEVISAILLNWIIFFFARLVIDNYYSPDGLLSQSNNIPSQFRFIDPSLGGWLPALIIFLVLVGIILFITKFTVFGHKVSSVGFSMSASKYAGYNVHLIHILTISISGAIAGIMGYILYTSGDTPAIPISSSIDSIPEQGMNGIVIGLIAMNNPIAIMPIAFLIGLLSSSAPYLDVPSTFQNLIIGLVILASAMFVILLNYKPYIYIKKWFYGLYAPKYYSTYENEMEALISKYRLLANEKYNKNNKQNQQIINNYQSIINDPKTSIHEKDIAKWKLNCILNNNNFDQSSSLYEMYIKHKKEFLGQYKKHLLILKATKIFFPEIEAKNIYNIKKSNYELQYLKYKTHQNTKLDKLKSKLKSSNSVEIQNKIKTIEKNILLENNKKEKWINDAQHKISQRYNQKSKIVNKQQKLNEYIKCANKLNIDQEQKQLLINWLNDSYLESIGKKVGGK